MLRCALLFALLFQGQPPGAGHWEGTVNMGEREMKLVVDLARSAQGGWIGDLDLPELGAMHVPLPKIMVKGAAVAFALSDKPQDPHFQGELSPDGKSMKGKLTQDGGTYPFQVRWVSEPSVTLPEKSTPTGKEAHGTWEGTITGRDGKQLRHRLVLSNGPDGLATGAFSFLDQDAENLPLTSIVQKGSSLRFSVKLAGLSFEGQLKGDELTGTFVQGGVSTPMTLKRVAPAK